MTLIDTPATNRTIRWGDTVAEEIESQYWHLRLEDEADPIKLHANPRDMQVLVTCLGMAFESPEPDAVHSHRVEQLTSDCVDMVWEDRDGDRYMHNPHTGEWEFSGERHNGTHGPWEVLSTVTMLEDYGPYKVVERREPRKVSSLGHAERRARWFYINSVDIRFEYYWHSGTWWGIHPGSTPVDIGLDGPNIGSGGVLTEIL